MDTLTIEESLGKDKLTKTNQEKETSPQKEVKTKDLKTEFKIEIEQEYFAAEDNLSSSSKFDCDFLNKLEPQCLIDDKHAIKQEIFVDVGIVSSSSLFVDGEDGALHRPSTSDLNMSNESLLNSPDAEDTPSEVSKEECTKEGGTNLTMQLKLSLNAEVKNPLRNCNSQTNKDGLVKQKSPLEGKVFKCKECGKRFNKNSNLTAHLRTHSGERPFKCEECGKRFAQNSYLIKHLRTHSGEKPFKCKECGKRFYRNSTLVQHLRTHSGEKPFKCNVCEKRLNSNSDLTKHLRTHSGERPFMCKECGKRFYQSSNLVQHLITHSGEKAFKCNECGKEFNQNANLTIHFRTHSGEKPFKCKECGKRFCTNSNLVQHLRTHSGEKAFKCNVCGKRLYTTNSDLTRHLRTHSR